MMSESGAGLTEIALIASSAVSPGIGCAAATRFATIGDMAIRV
jgi:hypothetical protein